MLDFGQLPEKMSIFGADGLSQEAADFVESPLETPVQTSQDAPAGVFLWEGDSSASPPKRV